MIDFSHSIMDVECDECGTYVTDIEGEWGECIAQLKEQGWRFFKRDGEWVASCFKHRPDYVKNLDKEA